MTTRTHFQHLVEPLPRSPEPALLPPDAIDIMRSYVERTEDLFVLPDMPARVLRRVEKRLPLADWEELLAIVDMTALGDGRAFMAFTTGGLHIKELLSDKPPFAVPECRNNGVFALTEHGLVGLDANEGTTLKKSWQDRARSSALTRCDGRRDIRGWPLCLRPVIG